MLKLKIVYSILLVLMEIVLILLSLIQYVQNQWSAKVSIFMFIVLSLAYLPVITLGYYRRKYEQYDNSGTW